MSADRVSATAPAGMVRGRHGALASPHHLATQAGLATLRAGGSAVDAAIATNASLAVVAGHSCGLGGDAFWLIWDPGAAAALALNGSGRAGSGASVEAAREAGLVGASIPLHAPWSMTVPGAVHSWGEAHARFGRLPWRSLLEPAIDLAEAFPATAGWLEAAESAAAMFGEAGHWARAYRPPDRPRSPGGIVRLPVLAGTLRRVADEGPTDLGTGALARRTADWFGERGVPIDAADLATHASDWADPLGMEYRGVRSLSHPPNSVGVIALQALGILGRITPPPATAFDGRGWHDPAWIH